MRNGKAERERWEAKQRETFLEFLVDHPDDQMRVRGIARNPMVVLILTGTPMQRYYSTIRLRGWERRGWIRETARTEDHLITWQIVTRTP